jgi:rod shape-determining protein MreC
VVSTTRRNTSQRLTLVILVLLSVTAITLQYKGESNRFITDTRNGVRDALSPVQRGLADVFRPIGDFFSGSVNYSTVTAENAQLRRQLSKLRLQILENQNAEQQLQAVLSEEHLPYVQNIPQLLAEVIGGASSNYEETFEINRGTADGVGVGMPVVAGAGLIGVVTTAGSSTAIVQTITDADSTFGVRIGSAGVVAVANGRGPGYALSLTGITSSTSIHKGETVFTNGVTGASLPAGLPVGTVASVRRSGNSLVQTVTVSPLANFSGLDYVTVLQWFPAP